MRPVLENKIVAVCDELFKVKPSVELSRPEEQFGDFACNVAFALAKELKQSPRQIAEAIAPKLKQALADLASDVSVAGAGFINIKLSDHSLIDLLDQIPAKSLESKVVVSEYSDPNPFKILHAGHIYTTVVGDAISNLMELAGGQVHRVNYGGDVGLHVARTMWSIIKGFGGEDPSKLGDIAENNRSQWLADNYVEGNRAYNKDRTAAEQIKELNKRIYAIHTNNDHESNLAKIYWTCRTWSYEAFDAFYKRLGTTMERYYPESEVADKGLELVKSQIGKTFTESDGAVIFDGDKYQLHTRVFINQQGLPTYEAKEVGLIVKKYEDYKYDKSVIITGNEQEQYMAVVFKAIEQFMPELVKGSVYVPHGMVRLAGGVKMSSRLGNIVQANDVLDLTAEAAQQLIGKQDSATTIGAIKYAFLKSRLGGDIIYDPKESVSLEGNSGPYLQYAHARAKSILKKAGTAPDLDKSTALESGERSLVRKMGEYAEVVDKATNELMPHHVCTYLYELAQVFNRFYENNRVIDDPRQNLRLALVNNYAATLKSGLSLLGLEAPDHL